MEREFILINIIGFDKPGVTSAVTDVLGKYGERLKALHIHDNDGNSDQHAIPFDGNIDMDRFVSKLKELEYYGMITLEVMRDRSDLYDDLTDEQFLAKAFEAGKKLFEMRQG